MACHKWSLRLSGMCMGGEVLDGCSPFSALKILCKLVCAVVCTVKLIQNYWDIINAPSGFSPSGSFFMCSPVVQLESPKQKKYTWYVTEPTLESSALPF